MTNTATDLHHYFDYPLPDTIAALRSSLYPQLAPIANRWAGLLRGEHPTFPAVFRPPSGPTRDATDTIA